MFAIYTILYLYYFFSFIGRNSYDLEIEDSDKPTIYTEKTADHEFSLEKPFSETDTATVIRRSHLRVDLPAAGLGQRPPSVVSSDQEFPPLEHKDIPILSPYATRLQHGHVSESAAQNKPSPDSKMQDCEQTKTASQSDTHYKYQETTANQSSTLDTAILKTQNLNDNVSQIKNQDLALNASNDQINFSKQEILTKGKDVSGTVGCLADKKSAQQKMISLEKSTTSTNQSSKASTNQDKNSSNDAKSMTNFINSATKNSFNEHDKVSTITTTTTTTAATITAATTITTTTSTTTTTISKMKPDVHALQNPNFDGSNKSSNKSKLDSYGQLQTTWEQEKLKADQIAATKAQHLSSKQFISKPPQVSGSTGDYQDQYVSSSREHKSDSDDKESETNLQEDSDSSDAKTITNMESLSPQIRQNLNRQEATPIRPRTSQVTPVTPDTMTADEAENLLSSR